MWMIDVQRSTVGVTECVRRIVILAKSRIDVGPRDMAAFLPGNEACEDTLLGCAVPGPRPCFGVLSLDMIGTKSNKADSPPLLKSESSPKSGLSGGQCPSGELPMIDDNNGDIACRLK